MSISTEIIKKIYENEEIVSYGVGKKKLARKIIVDSDELDYYKAIDSWLNIYNTFFSKFLYYKNNIDYDETDAMISFFDFLSETAIFVDKDIIEKFKLYIKNSFEKDKNSAIPRDKNKIDLDFNDPDFFEFGKSNYSDEQLRVLISSVIESCDKAVNWSDFRDILIELIESGIENNKKIISELEKSGIISTQENNINWLCEKIDVDEQQKIGLLKISQLNSLKKELQNHAENFMFLSNDDEVISNETFLALLSQALNIKESVFNPGIFDTNPANGSNWLVNNGLIESSLSQARTGFTGPNAWKLLTPANNASYFIIDKIIAKNLLKQFSSKNEFLSTIISGQYTEYDTSNKIDLNNFNFLGQELENLKIMIKSENPYKILIRGSAGSGKSTLLSSILRETNELAVAYKGDTGLESLRGMSKLLGNPVIAIDDNAVSLVKAKGMHEVQGANGKKTREVWVNDGSARFTPEEMASFDMVLDIPPMPLQYRQKLAEKLFNDKSLAEKISKSCSSPGEIVSLSEWSKISGQTEWTKLSLKLSNMQKAMFKVKESEQSLPITFYQQSENSIGFDEVVGCEDVLNQAKRLVAGYKNAENFEKIGAKVPKGVLLTGGPGFGKTYLARAIALEAGVPLLLANSAAMADNPQIINAVFDEAKKQAPCILFLDELDAIGATAKNMFGPPDPKRQAILNRMLMELDGFEGLNSVLVIGATHRAEVLDEALIRSGRLGWKINFSLPDRKGRLELWKFYTRNIKSGEINWDKISKISSGMNPADIAEAVNVAAMEAAINNETEINTKHLIKAIDKVFWGYSDQEKEVLEKELYVTSVHEAGHALMAYAHGMEIDRISVRPTHSHLGVVRMIPNEDKHSLSIEELEHKVAMMFAGTLSEQVVFGASGTGAGADLAGIRQQVAKMSRNEGLLGRSIGVDWNQASEELKSRIEREEEEFTENVRKTSLDFLRENSAIIKKLGKELVKNREMDGDEFEAWLDKNGIKKEILKKMYDNALAERKTGLNSDLIKNSRQAKLGF